MEHMILGLKAVVRVLIDDVPDGVERAIAEELLHDQDETRRKVESALGLEEDVDGESKGRYSKNPTLPIAYYTRRHFTTQVSTPLCLNVAHRSAFEKP